MNSETSEEVWLRERPRLFGVAYHITGSVADAEDAVSEAWLRFDASQDVQHPQSWLATVTARLALDIVRSPERSRVDYVGPWLPEVAHPGLGPEDSALAKLELDRAFVRILQELSPVDRVLFVLTEAYGVKAAELASVAGLTPAAARQRLSRARRQLAQTAELPRSADAATLSMLVSSLNDGDLTALTDLLSEGAVLWTDSGGLTKAARRPIFGSDKVSRFIAGIVGKYGLGRLEVCHALGGPVLLVHSADQVRAITVEMSGGEITGLQIQQNQHKIRIRQATSLRPGPLPAAADEHRQRKARGKQPPT